MYLHVVQSSSPDYVLLFSSPDSSLSLRFRESDGVVANRDNFFASLSWYRQRFQDIFIHFDQSIIL